MVSPATLPIATDTSDAEDIERVFEGAVVFVQATLPSQPTAASRETTLKLYGLYKQATEGDVNVPAPSMLSFDFKARSKWAAWHTEKGRPQLEAMKEYVILVEETFAGFTPGAEQQGAGGLEAPVTSTLAGAQREETQLEAVTLHHHAGQDDVAALARLVDAGTAVRDADADGATALHWAADRGAAAAAAWLLDAGADVAAVDGDGMTPLHYAACSGHEAVAELLVKAGASGSCKDADGTTPYELTPDWALWSRP